MASTDKTDWSEVYIEHDLDLVFKELNQQVFDIIEEEVIQLYNDLIDVGENVRDSGNFKSSFSKAVKLSNWKWEIKNEADYASILARGYLPCESCKNPRMIGSPKWEKGLDPMLRKVNRNIKEKTDKISL